MGGRPEGGFGDADHRHAELVVGVAAQAGPAQRVQVDIAVDDQQVDGSGLGQDGSEGGQFTIGEMARAGTERPGPVW